MFLYNFLANFFDNEDNVVFVLSLVFVLGVLLLWIIILLIARGIIKRNHYKKIAREELVSLGFSEFEDKKKSSKIKTDDNVSNIVEQNIEEYDKQEQSVAEDEVEVQEEQVEAIEDTTQEEPQEPQTIEPTEESQVEQPLTREIKEEQVEEKIEEIEESKVLEIIDETEEEKNEIIEEIKEEQVGVIEEEPQEEPQEPQTIEPTEEPQVEQPLNEEIKDENPIESKEVVKPAKKGRSYNGKYEIFQVADGYAYHLKASNGEILVTSETYRSRDGVIKAIDAVKRNLDTGEVRIFADKRGKYKFKLVSRNYRVLVISANYSVEKSATRASESFKKFALKADIVDIELIDSDSNTATLIPIMVNEDKPDGKFMIEKFDGEYSWDLKASNGQILCQAEGYTSKAGCLYSIETFKKNVETGIFKCIKDKNGRYCYKLYTPNGRICAVGESYNTKAGAESAANSVVSFFKKAEIIEIK